jgi:hypothetical protein
MQATATLTVSASVRMAGAGAMRGLWNGSRGGIRWMMMGTKAPVGMVLTGLAVLQQSAGDSRRRPGPEKGVGLSHQAAIGRGSSVGGRRSGVTGTEAAVVSGEAPLLVAVCVMLAGVVAAGAGAGLVTGAASAAALAGAGVAAQAVVAAAVGAAVEAAVAAAGVAAVTRAGCLCAVVVDTAAAAGSLRYGCSLEKHLLLTAWLADGCLCVDGLTVHCGRCR